MRTHKMKQRNPIPKKPPTTKLSLEVKVADILARAEVKFVDDEYRGERRIISGNTNKPLTDREKRNTQTIFRHDQVPIEIKILWLILQKPVSNKHGLLFLPFLKFAKKTCPFMRGRSNNCAL